jgi:hypothetical protein
MRWAGHVARMTEMRNAYITLAGKREGKSPLGRPRRRREDNIKLYIKEIGCDDVDSIHVAQVGTGWWRAVVNTVMNIRVP